MLELCTVHGFFWKASALSAQGLHFHHVQHFVLVRYDVELQRAIAPVVNQDLKSSSFQKSSGQFFAFLTHTVLPVHRFCLSSCHVST
jgi:hypothetical protein